MFHSFSVHILVLLFANGAMDGGGGALGEAMRRKGGERRRGGGERQGEYSSIMLGIKAEGNKGMAGGSV